MKEGYAVIVTKNGEAILVMGSEAVSGLEVFSGEDEDAIRSAGEQLLSFIGRDEAQPCFVCGGVEACEPDCPLNDVHSSQPALRSGEVRQRDAAQSKD